MRTQGEGERSPQRSPTEETRWALDSARPVRRKRSPKKECAEVQCEWEAVWPEGNHYTRGSTNLCSTFQKFSTNPHAGIHD